MLPGTLALYELIQLLPGGAVVLHDGRIRATNLAGAAALGTTPDELAGRLLRDLVQPHCAGPLERWLEDTREPAQPAQPFSAALASRPGDNSVAFVAGPATCAGVAWRVLLIDTPSRQESGAVPAAVASRLLSAHEEEGYRTIRALHDGPSQSLAAIRMSAHCALHEPDPESRAEELHNILAQADGALAQIRSLSNRLQPPQLRSLGLEAALRWHIGEIGKDSGVPISLPPGPLPRRAAQHIEEAGFRIAQEALANALRHAGAERITVALLDAADTLTIEIRDDGRGFDPQSECGDGLAGMLARALGIGGRLEVVSSPGRGTCVIVRLPWN